MSCVEESFATMQDLRDTFMGSMAFPESQSAVLAKQLITASEYLRVLFAKEGRDLDKELDDKKISSIIVRNVVAQMVKRSYLASTSSMPDVEVSNYSQTAGPYSMSFSPVSSGSGFYLRKDEKSLLGLGSGYAAVHRMW